MAIFRNILRFGLEALASFVLMLGFLMVLGQLLGIEESLPIRVVIAAILALAYVGLLRWLSRSRQDVRSFKKGSKAFADFYSTWYSVDGRVYVFCDDTDWLESDVNRPIVEALLRKGNRAFLFVRNTGGRVTLELQSAGVVVVSIPSSVVLSVKMSLRSDDGDVHLIIRDKSRPSAEKNVLLQTTDKYMVSFAENLFLAIDPSVFVNDGMTGTSH